MKTYKIVLTGGPCAGKTSALSKIKAFLNKKSVISLIVAETATELINAGITPENIGQINFQKNLLDLQLKKEQLVAISAEQLNKDSVIIFDRGCLDGKAYLSDNEYTSILNELNFTESDLIDRYDAVIFLDSAAMNDDMYSTSNNPARKETPKEAQSLNLRTKDVWKSHKNLTVIKNEKNFEDKLAKLLSVIEKLITEY